MHIQSDLQSASLCKLQIITSICAMLQVSEGNQGLMDTLVWMVSGESRESLERSLMVVLESLGKTENLVSTGRMVCLDCQ